MTKDIRYSYIVQWSDDYSRDKYGDIATHEAVYDNDTDAYEKYEEVGKLENLIFHRIYEEGEYWVNDEPTGDFLPYERIS